MRSRTKKAGSFWNICPRTTAESKPSLELLEDRCLLSFYFADGFEAPTFDPFWSMYTQSGSISLSTSQAHSGIQSARFSSTDTGLNKYVFLLHDFNPPIYGQTSVWILDTGAGVDSSNYIAFQVSQRGTNFAAGLTAFDYGFRGGGPGYGDQYNYYDQPIVNSALPTGIERTLAWHQYVVVDTPQALTLLEPIRMTPHLPFWQGFSGPQGVIRIGSWWMA